MLRCGKSVRGGVGCVRKCVRVWGKLWESVLGEVLRSAPGMLQGLTRRKLRILF